VLVLLAPLVLPALLVLSALPDLPGQLVQIHQQPT
jgi:hypothetical protein